MREGERPKESLSLDKAKKQFKEAIYFHKGDPDYLENFFGSPDLPEDFFQDSEVRRRVGSQIGALEEIIIPELPGDKKEQYQEYLKLLKEKFPDVRAISPPPDRSDEMLSESRSL